MPACKDTYVPQNKDSSGQNAVRQKARGSGGADACSIAVHWHSPVACLELQKGVIAVIHRSALAHQASVARETSPQVAGQRAAGPALGAAVLRGCWECSGGPRVEWTPLRLVPASMNFDSAQLGGTGGGSSRAVVAGNTTLTGGTARHRDGCGQAPGMPGLGRGSDRVC